MHLDLLPMLVAEADLLSKHNDRTPLNTTSLLALGADVERVGILLSRQERKQARLINASVRDAEWLQPDRHLGLGGGGGYANPSGLEAEEEMRVKYRSIVGETEALEQIVADKLERPARAGLKPVLKALPGR
jgi:hypothetical protein